MRIKRLKKTAMQINRFTLLLCLLLTIFSTRTLASDAGTTNAPITLKE